MSWRYEQEGRNKFWDLSLTLWSRLVIVFLICFIITCSSFAGEMILLSISSSSGATETLSSSCTVVNPSTLRTVSAASGFFPIKSYSPTIGWNNWAKCVEKPTPAVNSATQQQWHELGNIERSKTRRSPITASLNFFVSFKNFSIVSSILANFRLRSSNSGSLDSKSGYSTDCFRFRSERSYSLTARPWK